MFRKKRITNVEGFDFETFNSLLARERFVLIDEHKRIFSNVKELVELAERVAEKLGVELAIAWAILQGNGVHDGVDHRAEVMPFLTELQSLNDTDAKQNQYLKASVEIFLLSRLSLAWWAENWSALNESFPTGLTLELGDAMQALPEERLTDEGCRAIAGRVATALPDDIFNKIVDFIVREENGGKEPITDAQQETVDQSPKPSSNEQPKRSPRSKQKASTG